MGKGTAWKDCEFAVVDRDGSYNGDAVHFLKDKEELNEWLKDGSLERDDYIIEIKKLWKVEQETTVKRYIVEER